MALIAGCVGGDEIGSWYHIHPYTRSYMHCSNTETTCRIGFVLSGLTLGLLVSPFLSGIIYQVVGYYAVVSLIVLLLSIDLVFRLLIIPSKGSGCGLVQASVRQQTDHTPSTNRAVTTLPSLPLPVPDDKTIARQKANGKTSWHQDDETAPLLAQKCRNVENGKNVNETKNKDEHIIETLPELIAMFPMFIVLISPRLRTAIFGAFLHTLLTLSFDTVLPIFIQRTFLWNSSATGLTFLTLTLPAFLGSVVGSLADRYGSRIVTLSGFALSVPSLVLLGLLVREKSLGQEILCCALLSLVGVGLTLILTPLAADVFHEAQSLGARHPQALGEGIAFIHAYSGFNLALGLATAVGPPFVGALYEWAGWRATMCALAGLLALGSLLVSSNTGGRRVKDGEGDEGSVVGVGRGEED